MLAAAGGGDWGKAVKDRDPAASVYDVCDYMIVKLNEADVYLNTLKLHKLLYYVQAWHLAFHSKRCFNSDFQAWVHGPVCRPIYDRYSASKALYSRVRQADVPETFRVEALPAQAKRHTDTVLESYANFSDDQLEAMTHDEEPWQKAREGYRPSERCENVISDEIMEKYYKARLTA